MEGRFLQETGTTNVLSFSGKPLTVFPSLKDMHILIYVMVSMRKRVMMIAEVEKIAVDGFSITGSSH